MTLAQLNVAEFAPGDCGIDHPALHMVIDALEKIDAVYEELADAEPMLSEDHHASAAWFCEPAVRLALDGFNTPDRQGRLPACGNRSGRARC